MKGVTFIQLIISPKKVNIFNILLKIAFDFFQVILIKRA